MAKKVKKKKKQGMEFGPTAYLVGVTLSALAALVPIELGVAVWVVLSIALLGVVVGLLNIVNRETQLFLIATIAFLVASTTFSNLFATFLTTFNLTVLVPIMQRILQYVVIFTASAAAALSFKLIYNLSRG